MAMIAYWKDSPPLVDLIRVKMGIVGPSKEKPTSLLTQEEQSEMETDPAAALAFMQGLNLEGMSEVPRGQ